MRPLLLMLVLLLGAAPALAGDVEIGTLRTRAHVVRIIAGEPPRYTVTDRDGRVIAENATRAEIARSLPEVHRALEKGLAGTQDARLR